ncbi:MAG: type II secretion system F family protein, partial [Thermoguttaceae bacterium]
LLILAGTLAVLLSAAVIPAIVAVVVLPAVIYRRRRAHRYALLAAMAVAVRQRIPLIPVLLAFAAERRGYVARRAIRLAGLLRAGMTLPDAVDSAGGLFPPHIRLALRMGHDSGNLATVLQDVLDRADEHDAVEGQAFGKIAYFVILSLFMLLILSFMMLKIIPAMQKIFEEFGLELPRMTLLMISVTYAFVNYWYLGLPILLVAIWLGLQAVLRYVGAVERDVWGLAWLRRRVHTAEILETVALFVKAGRPITDALAGLARWYPTRAVRHRLASALDDILRGSDWSEALARRRLISGADRGVLLAAERVGNLAWASDELAESNRRRYLTRSTALVQSAFVALLLGYGMLVGFFFIANFLPLIKLIASMS